MKQPSLFDPPAEPASWRDPNLRLWAGDTGEYDDPAPWDDVVVWREWLATVIDDGEIGSECDGQR